MYGITVMLDLYNNQMNKLTSRQRSERLGATDTSNTMSAGTAISILMFMALLYIVINIYCIMVIFSPCFPDVVSRLLAIASLFFIPGIAPIIIVIAALTSDCRVGGGLPILDFRQLKPKVV